MEITKINIDGYHHRADVGRDSVVWQFFIEHLFIIYAMWSGSGPTLFKQHFL